MSDSSAPPPRDTSDDTRITGGPVDPADTGDRGFTGYRDPSVPRSDDTTLLTPDRGASTVTTERRSRTGAHVTSLVLSVVLVPAALVAADYALSKGWDAGITGITGQADTAAPERAMIAAGIAAACLLVVAALARLSGLGPFVAGILFGAVPSVLFALVPLDTSKRLLDIKDPYDGFMTGLLDNTIVFPLVGGLLLGLGLFGRWRGTKVTTTT